MSPSFLYTSYGVTWLGEKVHLFMTKKLIAIPFQAVMHGGGQDDLTWGNKSWTAHTRVYQWELSCSPSEIEPVRETIYKFSADRCTHVANPLARVGQATKLSTTENMMYIGFRNSPGDDKLYLSNRENCTDPNLFLAIWAKSTTDGLDLHAL